MPRYNSTIDVLRGMQKQEGTYSLPQDRVAVFQSFASNPADVELVEGVDLETYFVRRGQMLEWCYCVVDTCDFEKELLQITMSHIDRYAVINTELMVDPDLYQLAVIAAFYTAAKVHEESCLTPAQMEELAEEKFSAKQIEQMEIDLLMALKFKVNPATPATFSRCLLDLFPTLNERNLVEDVIEAQLDLAVQDEYLITCKPSSLACAVVMNALQTVPQNERMIYFWSRIAKALELDLEGSTASLINIRKYVNSLVLDSLAAEQDYEEEEKVDESWSTSKQHHKASYKPKSSQENRSPTTYSGRAA